MSRDTDICLAMLTSLSVVLAVLVVLLAYVLQYPHPTIDWDNCIIPKAKEMMGTTFHLDNDNVDATKKPLSGLTVVVTGATSGIGMGLTQTLIRMGATVVAMGRSPSKLEKLQQSLDDPNKERLFKITVELSDFASVREAADRIPEVTGGSIDVLVNNAGIHYNNGFLGQRTPTTKSGHDTSFAINYMSHFILTERMMPLLKNSTKPHPAVVQISSSFHVGVDGSELRPETINGMTTTTTMPLAARPGGLEGLWRDQRAYANSKLAQILHSRALQRRNHQTRVRFVSVCPAWVATNIAGNEWSPPYLLMQLFGFPVMGWGISSVLQAMLDTRATGDHFVNAALSDFRGFVPDFLFRSWVYEWGIRDTFAQLFATVLIGVQKFGPMVGTALSSVESYDENLQEALYEWTYKEVSEYL